MQNQNQSWRTWSHAFSRACRRLRVFASSSLCSLRLLWLAIGIALVLVLRRWKFEIRSSVGFYAGKLEIEEYKG